MPMEDLGGVNEQLLNKLRRANPNWNLNYTGKEGTNPVFDSGGEDYLSWVPGQGAGRDMPSPVLHTPYVAPDEQQLYTPEQLGYSALEANMLRSKGVQGLPAYMQKQRLYSPAVHLGGDDPVATYLNAMKTPTGGEIGKAKKILGGMGWGAGPEGMKFYGAPGETTDAYSTMVEPPAGEQPQWGAPEQQKFARDYLSRKWGVNDGTAFTNPEKAMNMIGSLASIAAPIAGIGALGAFAAPVTAGAEAGAAGAEATLPSLTASQISSEFPAMAGTSLAEGGPVATPGFFGSGIGVPGSADLALGGMYGTGAGIEGAALSNVPVQNSGQNPSDFLKDKAKSYLRNYAVKKAAGALAPEPNIMETGGGQASGGEAAQSVPQIESGYYNRFTGERLTPEEFFKYYGRAQSAR
jgi:hypothetical protein